MADMADKEKDIERIRKTMAQQSADFVVMKESLMRDLKNRCEKVTELEVELDEVREKYNNLLRNGNNTAQQKKIAFLERNLEQLTNVQKQLVEQNSSLNKEIAIAERKLLARNERIQALEILLQDAQEKLTTQNQDFEAKLQAVRERQEKTRSQKSDFSSSLSFGRVAKPVKEKKEQLVTEEKKQLTETNEHINLAHQDIENLRKELQMEKNQVKETREQYEKQLKELNEKDEKIKQLQTEIICLRYQELAPQVRNKRTELEQLIANVKIKISGLEKMVDLLLETQKQIMQTTETPQKDKLNGKLGAYQIILEDNLTKEELQNLLDKQIELHQLEEQLSKLKQTQQQNQEQTAQII